MTAPAQPSRTAWRPSSPGNRKPGRNRSPSPRNGISRQRASTTTPAVVPAARITWPVAGEAAEIGLRAVDQGVTEIRTHHRDAGQQRGDHRPGEPVVGLQHSGQHDADAVQRQLRGEDPEHLGRHLLTVGRNVRQQPGDRPGQQGDQDRDRHQQGQHPGEQRGRGGADPGAVPVGDRPGQQRHHETGQRTPGDQLEDDVRDGVGGVVDVGQPFAGPRCAERRTSGRTRRSRATTVSTVITRRGPGDPRRPVPGSRGRSLTAQFVERTQPRGVLDDLGEADPSRWRRSTPASTVRLNATSRPRRPGLRHQSDAQQRAERVGARSPPA